MTTTEHSDLAARLAALADEPAPPAAFDVATSITRGRARLRRRQRFTVGAVAAATALVIGATLVLEPSPAGAPAAPAAPASVAPAPSTPPAKAGTGVLATEVKFGWLPDWVDGERGISYLGSVTSAGEGGMGGRSLMLSLFPAGPEPAIDVDPKQKQEKVPAPDVNGRTAYWLVHPAAPTFDNSSRLLRWLTPSGRWAQLTGWRGRSQDVPDDALLRVAAGVQVGNWDVPLPFWLAGPPSSVRLTGASLTRPQGSLPWGAQVTFSAEDRKVRISVAPDRAIPPGEPAQEPFQALCRVDQGIKVCVGGAEGKPPALAQLGGLQGLLNLVHVTGADESSWTTDVLR
ncbi:hypothetical protein [Kitasatospora sp. NPDC087314]|uniref:hypothetical protein n=1 Tax=Kitasatospora sp. NPDC087314 TaxID=3364068 RepID=UPI003805CC04